MSATVATAPLTSSTLSPPASGVWSRLFQQFAPRVSRFLPKIRAGRFLLELGQPAEWKSVDVVLAGGSLDDLGLYYYEDALDRERPPLGWIPLHAAHIDTLEEVLMVVTADKTWFLCASQARDASDWASDVCAAIDRASDSEIGSSSMSSVGSSTQSPRSQQSESGGKKPSSQRQRLSSSATAATLRELQSRDATARVDEFLEVFVRCSAGDARAQALKGALSWSCVRNLAWKVWLDYIPGDLQIRQWVAVVTDKRLHYVVERKRLAVLSDNVAGRLDDAEFVESCDAAQDSLLYDIYKDVRRTRGHVGYFRDPQVQALMIRVLYTYSKTHPAVSYNQGMSELLATLVYLLHIEQWPTGSGPQPAQAGNEAFTKTRQDAEITSNGGGYDLFKFTRKQSTPRLRTRSTDKLEDMDPADASYVYVESFLGMQSDRGLDGDDAFLDRDALLRLPAFAGASGRYYECCRDAAEEVVRELTLSEFIEHDAYGLLEELMLRMAGTFCPDVVVVPLSMAKTGEHILKRSHLDSQRQHASPSGVSHASPSAELSASPLYEQMNRIHEHILRRCDPPTARCLSRLGVEPQMFLLRWVRVLMAREFDLPHVWHVWDAIFSLTPSDFSFINLLCAAVVRAFRDEIEAAEDATGVLLALRDVADRISADQLVASARELYDALLIAAAAEASSAS